MHHSEDLFSMTRTIVAAIVLVLSLSTIVAVSNFSTASLVSAKISTSAGRMHLDEGIKVLSTGNIRGALMHLHIADKILSGITSGSAQTGRMHLDEGIKVLSTGNIRGALMHLHIADKILGKGS
jgi:phosphoheptose isomerase